MLVWENGFGEQTGARDTRGKVCRAEAQALFEGLGMVKRARVGLFVPRRESRLLGIGRLRLAGGVLSQLGTVGRRLGKTVNENVRGSVGHPLIHLSCPATRPPRTAR